MFEKRPIWGLIVGLNVCILIWLISVQEPVTFDVNTAALSSSNNYIINAASTTVGEAAQVLSSQQQQQQQQQSQNSNGRDLLSKHLSAQSNEYFDELSVAASTLTTSNVSNHYHHNNSSSSSSSKNNNNINNSININYTFDDKILPKTNDLSLDIQSLTSSLGTGAFNLKTKPTPSSWATLTAIASALPAKDFNQLINLQNFRFLMTQPICGSHIAALILIHSAPKNYDKRQLIRDTWGSITNYSPETPLRILFLLGSVNDEQIQNDLQNENNIHRDIVQGSFIDDYRNMTYKHVMAFKWFLYNCPQAQILIKVDDDVYVNTPQLVKYFKDHEYSQREKVRNDTTNDNPTIGAAETVNKTTKTITINIKSIASKPPSDDHEVNIFASTAPLAGFNASQELFNHPQNLLFCQKLIGSLVKRSYRSKWRVSFKEYSQRYYPPYCPGYTIIYSSDVILRLYKAAQKSKYFWIDDVHITGVMAQQTNTTITTSSHYVLYSDVCDQLLTGKTDLSKTEFLFAWHSISAQKIKDLWHLYNNNEMAIQNKHQVEQLQKQLRNDEYLVDNRISSAYSYTSTNGFR